MAGSGRGNDALYGLMACALWLPAHVGAAQLLGGVELLVGPRIKRIFLHPWASIRWDTMSYMPCRLSAIMLWQLGRFTFSETSTSGRLLYR